MKLPPSNRVLLWEVLWALERARLSATSHMVEAVKIIVPQLLDEGYQLVTVWELLNLSEGGFVPGQVYRHQ